jgi:hypothetical protein
MGIIDDGKLQNILPKYSELKLSGKNLAQQYVSAFNTGMNIYQCINQLQGYIEWVIKAVNDVVVQWNEIVDSQIKDAINATKQATTEQFNIEWAKNKSQLDVEIKGMVQDHFNIDWQERENAINLKITDVSNNLSNFKTETDTRFTTTKKELTSLINTTINTTINNTINSIYPIGSVYISLTETNPGTYLKGTWEQFGQGRTLIGVGTGDDGTNTQEFEVNTTGGEYKHKLVIDEIPSHSHKYHSPIVQEVTPSSNTSTYGNYMKTYKIDSDSVGGDGYHNNVQPYIAVYFWKRVN